MAENPISHLLMASAFSLSYSTIMFQAQRAPTPSLWTCSGWEMSFCPQHTDFTQGKNIGSLWRGECGRTWFEISTWAFCLVLMPHFFTSQSLHLSFSSVVPVSFFVVCSLFVSPSLLCSVTPISQKSHMKLKFLHTYEFVLLYGAKLVSIQLHCCFLSVLLKCETMLALRKLSGNTTLLWYHRIIKGHCVTFLVCECPYAGLKTLLMTVTVLAWCSGSQHFLRILYIWNQTFLHL